MASTDITLEAVPSIGEVSPEDWDACANPGKVCNGHGLGTSSGLPGDSLGPLKPAYNPFVSHAFLSAAEKSGSATIRTGWGPRHLVAKIGDRVAGVVPCYLKSHSQGEYVFDRGWADAYERAGGRYYPKLQVSVPFTPATGPRLLVRDGVDHARITEALASGLVALCGVSKASSVHVTFAREAEWKLLAQHGFLQRTDQQFHWRNEGFATFDDFLATLNSRHRKSIKRERRDALAAGITIHWLTGKDITEDAWDAFFEFYMETGSRKWGRPYLTREFFALIGETMSEDVLLVMARRNDRWIAGALNFVGADTLYGRYWGTIDEVPFLHFELCYYRAIEWAIDHGLASVQAGAQGEHKVARGYEPVVTKSAHFIPHRSFRDAVADFIETERAAIAAEAEWLRRDLPYRSSSSE